MIAVNHFANFHPLNNIRREQEKKTIAERAVLRDDVVDNEDNATLSDDERDCDEQEEAKDYVHDVMRFLALFLLKTKEELTNQLSQQTINAILGNTEDVVESSMQCLKDKIITCLTNNNINIADVAGLNEILVEPKKRCVLIKKLILQYSDCISIVIELNFLVISLRDQSELMYLIMGQKESAVKIVI